MHLPVGSLAVSKSRLYAIFIKESHGNNWYTKNHNGFFGIFNGFAENTKKMPGAAFRAVD